MTLRFGQINDFRFYPHTQAGFQQAHLGIDNSVPVKIWGSEEVINTSGFLSTYSNRWLVLKSHGRSWRRDLGSTSSSFWRDRQRGLQPGFFNARCLPNARSLLLHAQVHCRLLLVHLSPLLPLKSRTVPTLTKCYACYQWQF